MYVTIELILEVWFEWNAFAYIEILNQYHWLGGVGTGSMLVAHWLYFLAGILGLFNSNVVSTDSNHTKLTSFVLHNFETSEGPLIEKGSSKVNDSKTEECNSV